MTTFITRKHLSRRTMLRGLGIAASLPLLDAMVPAMAGLSDKAVTRQLRFGAVYIPNGSLPEVMHPKELGADFTFTEPMKSLEAHRKQLITVKNLIGSGAPAPHLGASCGWLNGVGAINGEGLPILSRKTLDQYIVDKIGQDTPLPSIELGTEDMGTSVGACDAFACAYFNSIAWRTDSAPLPVEINPRLTFESMYGDTGTTAQRIARLKYKTSILDSLSDEVQQLNGTVSAGDRRLVANYLDNIREVERRVQRLMERSENSNTDVPAAPAGIPETFPEHVALIYDLMHLAYQGDISRVFTYLTAVEASNQGYSWIGVPDSHHVCSHHGGVPAAKAKYMKIVTWHIEQFGGFVQKLKDTPDGDGSLLDHSLLYIGGGLGNGNVHDRHSPAAIIVGGANGRLLGNRSVDAKGSLGCNLLLNLGEMAGIEIPKIGPSSGKVTGV